MQITRSRFFVPAAAVAFGLAMLVAQWIGGDPRNGVLSLNWLGAITAISYLAAIVTLRVRG